LAGTRDDLALEGLVYAAAAADVRDVMVGGHWIVRDGRHLAIDAAAELRAVLAQ
jgi:cytosine/adenosine deaminase-related metal-dependent hydrolase